MEYIKEFKNIFVLIIHMQLNKICKVQHIKLSKKFTDKIDNVEVVKQKKPQNPKTPNK